MQKTLSPEAINLMPPAIDEAGGNEVFFLGPTDDELRVTKVEVLPRGSEQSVLAILQNCNYSAV